MISIIGGLGGNDEKGGLGRRKEEVLRRQGRERRRATPVHGLQCYRYKVKKRVEDAGRDLQRIAKSRPPSESSTTREGKNICRGGRNARRLTSKKEEARGGSFQGVQKKGQGVHSI